MGKVYSKEVIKAFKEYVRQNPEKSYDKIQRELKGTPIGIRKEVGLKLVKEVKEEKPKIEVGKGEKPKPKEKVYSKEVEENFKEYVRRNFGKSYAQIQRELHGTSIAVRKKVGLKWRREVIAESKEGWYWTYQIKATLSQTHTQIVSKRGKRRTKKTKSHKKVEFYINSGVRMSKHDITIYVRNIILKEEQSWKLDKIDHIREDRRRYTDFAGRIKAIMSA